MTACINENALATVWGYVGIKVDSLRGSRKELQEIKYIEVSGSHKFINLHIMQLATAKMLYTPAH